MSCINLSLPPAKKAWRSFTSKLQNKLHMLNKSKSIKKNKHRFNPSLAVKPAADPNRPRKLFNPFKRRRRCKNRFLLHKKAAPAPVYVDKLFREEVVVAKCSSTAKTMKFLDNPAVKVSESSSKVQDGKTASERECQADDMWESLGFASPQMRGIDERAEQFIASFRAEMEVQEMMDYDFFIENGSSLS